MSLGPGQRLGPYEVLRPLGAGGMGQVWRARDTRLGREVALKILPDEFAGSAERRSRLEHEAKLLASLNQPAIATLHDSPFSWLSAAPRSGSSEWKRRRTPMSASRVST